ncbi:DUF222 domain-containing protein [Microbacterium sp.]|uniref:HNH endonuclease signature motif containing protein n=1 Tax=Microbacterium sp. TaxID=51671 RepID=UPI0039E4624B
MAIFTELDQHVDRLRVLLGDDAEDAAAAVSGLCDDDVAAVIRDAGALARAAERLGIVASGVAARRSTREAGHKGLAQKRGHRNTVSLVQELTGSTRADAAKHVRLGESLLEATTPGRPEDEDGAATPATEEPAEPWHAPLGQALLAGTVSSAQHDAILRNLGEPPAVDPDSFECSCASRDDHTEAPCACIAAIDAATVEAWSLAAQELVQEASQRTVEELRIEARAIRDRLDPDGAERRHLARFEARAFRMWTDADGIHRGSFSFDDLGAAWVRTIIDTALRPRRGGPRFVDADEKARAEELVADPRTNDQLAYDLMMDVLRSGALADAEAVFGTKQAGVRMVTVIDTASPGADAAHLEDTGDVVPAWAAAQHTCDTATTEITVDRDGNPLYLGREARLFSPKQRLTLALRDGGCRIPGCDRPAHYCEAHHLDEWAADHGRTDVDRGILLCRFHHMALHHGGWRITRDGLGDFVLHRPGHDSIVLKPRLHLAYAWAGIDPPPRRFRPAA